MGSGDPKTTTEGASAYGAVWTGYYGDPRGGALEFRGATRSEEVNDTCLLHPWFRINRVMRVMLQTRWSAEQWSVVRVEFRRAVALRDEIRRAGWFN